jgi:NhaP-type Na+/H+ or K+/H+ antiporter
MEFARGSSVLVLLLVGLVAIVVWTGFSRRLERWHITPPFFMVVVGIGAGLVIGDSLSSELDTDAAERVVELILAVLLFLDAAEVRGGFFAGERGIVVRLLAIAFPLSLGIAFVLGFPLLDASSWPVLLAVACVVMPIDFAPSIRLLRQRTVRRGVRHALAVESGYNDGIASPLFALAILVIAQEAGDTAHSSIAEIALLGVGMAIVVGIAVGVLSALLVRAGTARGWTTVAASRMTMVIVPVLTYEIASHLEGNGFVAAFLAGIAYKIGRTGRRGVHRDLPPAEMTSVEDVGAIVSMIMWVVLGAVSVLVVEAIPPWTWILYAALALTLVRMLPVWIAMLGTPLTWRERTALGLYGPRGTSSIVFGLLAFNAMREEDADMTLIVTVIVVFFSVVLHGLILPNVSFRRRRAASDEPDQPPMVTA